VKQVIVLPPQVVRVKLAHMMRANYESEETIEH